MSSIAVEILLILLLTMANGLFSGAEIAVISVRKVRLEQLAKRGSKQARLALKLANSPNDFLSSVQVGITLIGILSGAVGGATLSLRLEAFLGTIAGLAPYSEPLSLLIVVTIITYLSLVIGELLPKRIALNNPEQIACAVAKPLRLLVSATAPVVKLLSVSTDGLLKLLGIQPSDAPAITEEEINVLMQQGTQAGMFEESEQEMVSRVFRLGDRSINALMTPRIEVVWLDIDAPWEENQREIKAYPHAQYPVGRDSLDHCLGIVRMKDILTTYLEGEPANLQHLLRPPLYVPEGSRALHVLELFQDSRTHVALVTDEYGGIEGMVTLNDLVEAIVGEIPSVDEVNEPQIVQRDDGSWLLDGLLSIDTLKTLLHQESLPDEADERYHTLGGFMVAMLKHIPISGEHFDAVGFRFEVVDMDGTRVDKVLVTTLSSEAVTS